MGERSGQTLTVADRLRGARRRWFVGRRAEVELFRDAVAAPEPAFSVLWIHGPGGVGKTTLLRELADVSGDAGRDVVALDLRALEPSPPALARELDGLGERSVLLLDTFERASGLEDWLREVFVPGLPAGAITVVAGRSPPAEAWRRDPGWRDLLRVVALRNLGPDDARTLLGNAGVAAPLRDPVLELTHGHPLALSLLVDVLVQDGADAPPADLAAVPDVVAALVSCFMAGVPGARHRDALEVAAQARFTTVPLLRRVFGVGEGEALFAWLRGLSFMETAPQGLFPHDLARDVIVADLRWRDPGAFQRVHRDVRADVVERIETSEGAELQRAVTDLIHLHRGSDLATRLWDWKSFGHVYADARGPGDDAAILAMVERHEGAESAAIAAHWLARRPHGFSVIRGSDREPVGFLAQFTLHDATEADLARDPAARSVWEHALRHGAPRPQDDVMIGRFVMDRDAYQAPSPSFNVVTIRSAQEWLSRPRLSWYYLVFADAGTFAPMAAYIDFERTPDADFEVAGRRFAVFARDWRRSRGADWLELMGTRELASGAPAPREPAAPEVALSHAQFAAAVRAALRDVARPDALAANPLLRARVVHEHGDGDAAALRDLLEQAVAELETDPRGGRLARAVERTYLKPAPTQEAAAELLGLPFSTYRGHLARGIERVTDWLWQRELYG